MDARDDYSARRHLLESKNVIPQWTVDHANGETDDDQFYEGEEFQVDSHLSDEEYEHIGKEGERVIRQMMEMDEIIKNSGWLDKSHNGLPTVDLSVVKPVRNMVINYPFYFPFLLLHLLKHFHYFLGNEICLERYFSYLQVYVLFRIVMRSLPLSGSFAEFQHTFLFQKHFVGNMFGTPVRPPRSLPQDRGLRVTKNTFL